MLGSLRKERVWLEQAWGRLQEFAGTLDLTAEQKRLLEMRWFEEAKHYDQIWRHQRLAHQVLGVVTIVVGLAIPFLVAVDAPDWAVAFAGVVVGTSGALEGFFRLGERWRHIRRTAMLIHNEGIRFFERRAPYDKYESHQAAFPEFLDRLERINETQSEDYIELLRQAVSADELVRAHKRN